METQHLIFTIIQVILAVALVVIVTMQSGKNSGLSSATKWIGGVFVLLTLALNLF